MPSDPADAARPASAGRPAFPRGAGLSSDEALRRLATVGPNALPEAPPIPLWRRFLAQFQSPLIYLLLFALVFDLATWLWNGADHGPAEALAIAAVLLLNASLGAHQERRSERALAQLQALAAPLVWVVRDGAFARIATRELVPGDLLRVEAGERVSADGRWVEAHGVLVDEAVLTGESLPLERQPGEEAFCGTLVVRGKGLLEVTRTGAASAMGRLATMLGSIRAEPTPLERRLDVLGHQIAKVVAVLAAALAVVLVAMEGVARAQEAVLFAAALAIAAVPEGLPAVVTLALARGVQRMARRRAVVRRLSAVEALGSVTVIATDKTGTLTENRMAVRGLDAPDPLEALRAMVLANDADDGSAAGDPLEQGLLEHARGAGLDVAALRAACPRCALRPFDSAWKFMRVTVDGPHGLHSYLKGAPEVVLPRCGLPPSERTHWLARAEEGAGEGYRVIALAGGPGEAEEGLQFLGLVRVWDPPRPEVREALARARAAGVRVLMVTGDHPGTARAVARAVGFQAEPVLTGADLDALSDEALAGALREAQVFARVTPEQKLRLVDVLQRAGEIVAMTGDGVNDAPALKRADVGVAMGQRGSDVAREVADLVLLDDDFASIVGAIEEGRSIYENIQSFARFLFSTNIALVTLVVAGVLGSWLGGLREAGALLLPLTALQLLWINFLGDGPPALALALDRHPDVMERPPRPPSAPLLDRPSLRFALWTGFLKAAAGLALLIALPLSGYGVVAVRTAVFLYQSVAQLIFAYPARRIGGAPERNGVLHAVIAGSIGLSVATVLVPPLRRLLGLAPLDASALAAVGFALLATWALAEFLQRLWNGREAGFAARQRGRAST
jgi:Ca2+-transporting ATPase